MFHPSVARMNKKERKQNIRQVKTDYIPIFYGDKSV